MVDSLNEKTKISVFHDSGCPMCRTEVAVMSKLDADNSITWVDINADDDPLTAAGISYEDAMRNIHVRDSVGNLVNGVEGFMAMWERLPGYRRLVPIVNKVPGVRSCLNLFYSLFSKVRMRIYRERIALRSQ